MRSLFLVSILAVLVTSSRITAEAPVPSPSTDQDCSTVIFDMVDCVPYLSSGSNEKLDPLCCQGLQTVFAINPKCICEGLKFSAQIGIPVNMTRAALLPSACGVHVSLVGECHSSLPPSGAEPVGPPESSPPPDLPPSGERPASPSGGGVPAPAPSKGRAYSNSVPVLMSVVLVTFSAILV